MEDAEGRYRTKIVLDKVYQEVLAQYGMKYGEDGKVTVISNENDYNSNDTHSSGGEADIKLLNLVSGGRLNSSAQSLAQLQERRSILHSGIVSSSS